MHRTTTTATLLVTVAVAALAGCVTVQRPPASGPSAPARPAAPRPDGNAEPRDVQAPALEALETVGPARPPKASAHAQVPVGPARTGERHRTPNAHSPGRPTPHPGPPHHRHPLPARVEPPGGRHAIPGNPGICALGRQYGGWRPDSPESRICGQAYGR
ncbi:hypothetical protein ACH4UM_28145 [Streptomyces sp. NPDC020801]|uniref:hypothetical protein n=1 Tax=unclassified Streptomyces TaxID=2593676 RepID=UPI0037A72BEA